MRGSSFPQIEAYEELLADVINICAHMFESHLYLTPAERHMFVKVGSCLESGR